MERAKAKTRSGMERALDDMARRYYQVMYGSRAAYGDLYDMGRDFYGRESHERR